MYTCALIIWLTTMFIAGGFCAYFFYQVLTDKKKPEPASYAENDEKVFV
jgi:hypothetical protein